jgi:hypothetical protein
MRRNERMASGNETPLEYMMKIICDETAEFDRRFDLARDAAHYLHPKLAAMVRLFPNKPAELPPELRELFKKQNQIGRKVMDSLKRRK